MNLIPLNVSFAARISFTSGCEQLAQENASGAKRNGWAVCCSELLQGWGERSVPSSLLQLADPSMVRSHLWGWVTMSWHGLTAATATPTPTCTRWGEIWSLVSYHRINFYCKLVTSAIVKCFYFSILSLGPSAQERWTENTWSLNRCNAISHSVSQLKTKANLL